MGYGSRWRIVSTRVLGTSFDLLRARDRLPQVPTARPSPAGARTRQPCTRPTSWSPNGPRELVEPHDDSYGQPRQKKPRGRPLPPVDEKPDSTKQEDGTNQRVARRCCRFRPTEILLHATQRPPEERVTLIGHVQYPGDSCKSGGKARAPGASGGGHRDRGRGRIAGSRR